MRMAARFVLPARLIEDTRRYKVTKNKIGKGRTFDYKGDTQYSSGDFENGNIYIQVKATDKLKALKKDPKSISFDVSMRHVRHWYKEPMPVVLVVYSVADNEAYWLHVQPYLNSSLFKWPTDPDQIEVTVHLSRNDVVDRRSIETFRQLKADVMSRIGNTYAQ